MGLASIALAILAVLFTGLGFVFTPVPIAGTVFAFGAPVLAILGMVLGGLAMSRSKRQGSRSDSAQAGVILCAMAFLPALGVALTCGVCNAAVSSGGVSGTRQVNFNMGGPMAMDGGMPRPDGPPPPPFGQPDAGPNPTPGAPSPGTPPPAYPPPPMPR